MKLIGFEADDIDLGKVELHLTVSPLQDALKLAENINKHVGKDVDIEVKQHREKRSLNANAYERLLEGKLADSLGTSKDEIHNWMLFRYGQYLRDKDGNIVFVLVPDSVDYAKDPDIHLKPTGRSENRNGMKYCWFAQMKPTHDYDSKEMAILIDGVISECEELGINTERKLYNG